MFGRKSYWEDIKRTFKKTIFRTNPRTRELCVLCFVEKSGSEQGRVALIKEEWLSL
ncbi:Hypothetical protein CINCED_3A004153 [Cinara cedri]|uniref:Uncharacterized protein n=1 Tax=Cinara cedri TaxID=506608 RepID=A0A5E4MVZ4_9HEMI|nr:Hypothetical protein CINCED_3A004153 [Cinara cedri]